MAKQAKRENTAERDLVWVRMTRSTRARLNLVKAVWGINESGELNQDATITAALDKAQAPTVERVAQQAAQP